MLTQKLRQKLFVAGLVLLAPAFAPANTETQKAREQRIQWWREARFGMFIHWGLYAIPGGTWKDTVHKSGYSEWIMFGETIPAKEYEKLAGKFNPVKFDAKAWAAIAKTAGMKYLVFTTKHHDGFSMFQSDMTPYNVAAATPFKRDVTRELVDACRDSGLRFGCYYSVDHNWVSAGEIIFRLVEIVSKGGNYLLNVGPTPEGLIPQPCIDRLAKVGEWMAVNGEAIYGTSASVFAHQTGKPVKGKTVYGKDSEVSSAKDWRCTTKPGKIYLHIFNWPTTGTFELAGLQSKVTQAYLLGGHKKLKVDQTATGVSLALPAAAPDKIASVICLEIADSIAKVTSPK